MDRKNIGFIGAGNMAQAIAQGLITSKIVPPCNIIASAKTTSRLDTIWQSLGTKTSTKNSDVLKEADIIFLCVKPHILPGVLDEINAQVSDDKCSEKLFVSVAAGITIDFIESKLGSIPKVKVIRTMPNTPCLVMSGVVIFCLGMHCDDQDRDVLCSLMKVVGLVEEVEEKNVDAMSSLMGCSIAWFYNLIEGISDGAVKNGVPRDISYKLAAKAMEGSAKMILQSGKHAGQLKDECTSPNGSTICGTYELEQAGLRGIMMRAVDAATERNKELGKQ